MFGMTGLKKMIQPPAGFFRRDTAGRQLPLFGRGRKQKGKNGGNQLKICSIWAVTSASSTCRTREISLTSRPMAVSIILRSP